MNFIIWIKNNKLAAVLLAIVLFLLFKDSFLFKTLSVSNNIGRSVPSASYEMADTIAPGIESGSALKSIGSIMPRNSEPAPQSDVKERMVVETSNISMVVDDVRQKTDEALAYIEGKGGYMVESRLNQPQEAPYATLTVRVPSKELRPSLAYLRGLAVKITSENLTGSDVTDQYMDIEARLTILERNKAKFEEIMAKAEEIDDILRVQREIMSLQSQIDSLKGQQQYLQKTAENAKLTLHMSTDEWSLPYAPSDKWRPQVVFKTAVRSLVITLRGLIDKLIWVAVYSPIWLPVVLIYWWWKRRKIKNMPRV